MYPRIKVISFDKNVNYWEDTENMCVSMHIDCILEKIIYLFIYLFVCLFTDFIHSIGVWTLGFALAN
jgi:hypothetical protein